MQADAGGGAGDDHGGLVGAEHPHLLTVLALGVNPAGDKLRRNPHNRGADWPMRGG
jgi:hypothetical protein